MARLDFLLGGAGLAFCNASVICSQHGGILCNKKNFKVKNSLFTPGGGGGLKTILQWFGHIKFIPDRSPTGKALRPKR